MLEKITSPCDIRELDYGELALLSEEIRDKIINTVSKNGGHLGSNLGIVETVISIHRCFNTPEDSLIFDVGHQCYAHKLLTGRYNDFDTLRRPGGMSGFTNRDESQFDTVTAGHCGTSLSAAIGIAEANKLLGNGRYTVCVVGDGALTNGEIWEALNNSAGRGLKLIIILNDNEMSISRNVGALSQYLTGVRTSRKYFKLKHHLTRFFASIPLIGKGLARIARLLKNLTKRILISRNLFECLGLRYIGPIDGNDMKHLDEVLTYEKNKGQCSLVHIVTKKGKGYLPAEEHPEHYHSVSPFDVNRGVEPSSGESFTSVFADLLCNLAERDSRICAITAAMGIGTGLDRFAESFPERFFDVGIAEEHAVTFASGLALAGLKPICVLYSTFAQRVYDQIWQDAALQKLPIVFAFDRGGFVSGDGLTHQGIFDVAMMRSIPGITVYSPSTYSELSDALLTAFQSPLPVIIRYPKDTEAELPPLLNADTVSYTEGEFDAWCISYGCISKYAPDTVSEIKEKYGLRAGIIKLNRVYPADIDAIAERVKSSRLCIFLEEGIKSGSVSESIIAGLAERGSVPERCEIRAVDNEFVPHGSREMLLKGVVGKK